MKFRLIVGVMLAAVVTVMFGSCTSDKDSSGLEYMPDMYRSPAIEPYVDYGELQGRENKEVKMKQSALTPPMGTIPYYGTDKAEVELMLPWSILPSSDFKVSHGLKGFDFTAEDTYNTQAAQWTTNPLPLSGEDGKETFAHGKELYVANCMHCHGEKGDGKGQMMVNGTFVGVPNYGDKKALSEGQLFYSIYYGKGAMGSHASQVNKKEIWTLVHYIRKFQDPEYGKGMGGSTTMATAEVEEVEDWSKVDVAASKGHHLKMQILFDSGSDHINMQKSLVGLNAVLEFMKSNEGVHVELAGHTDSDGKDEDNVILSQKRAEASKAWMVANGIDASRIAAKGYGESQLVMMDNAENAEASRRIELIIK